MIYIMIFFAEMTVVSLFTIRTIFITRGEKNFALLIGLVEISIWLYISSKVLTTLDEDIFRGVAYALGFGFGNYVGTLLENKLAIGKIEVKLIVKDHHGEELADFLREKGYAVTRAPAIGKDLPREILILYVKRKKFNELKNLIMKKQENVVITKTNIDTVYGGHGLFG